MRLYNDTWREVRDNLMSLVDRIDDELAAHETSGAANPNVTIEYEDEHVRTIVFQSLRLSTVTQINIADRVKEIRQYYNIEGK